MSTGPTPEPPGRALDIDADEVAGALAARRELGQDAEPAVIAGFLDRVGEAIDAMATGWTCRVPPERQRPGGTTGRRAHTRPTAPRQPGLAAGPA